MTHPTDLDAAYWLDPRAGDRAEHENAMILSGRFRIRYLMVHVDALCRIACGV